MNKVRLQILRQINDHKGECDKAENEYKEEFLYLTVNVPKKYKNSEIGTVILDYSWKNKLKKFIPKINNLESNNLKSKKCFVGSGAKFNMKVHDYKLTIINAIIVKL